MWCRSTLQALPALLLFTASAFAQVPLRAPPSSPALALVRVYLDCQACDTTFLRQEIHYLDFVVDPHSAEVHVLVTVRRTGAAGHEYTIKYIGLKRFAGDDRTLLYTSSPTDTEDEERRGFARLFGLGLTPYLMDLTAMDSLELAYDDGKPQSAELGRNPWNSWIFRLSGSMQVNAESSSDSHHYRGSISANRTTETWKTSFFNSNVQTNVFRLSDGSRLHSRFDDWRARQLVVPKPRRRSVGRRGSRGGGGVAFDELESRRPHGRGSGVQLSSVFGIAQPVHDSAVHARRQLLRLSQTHDLRQAQRDAVRPAAALQPRVPAAVGIVDRHRRGIAGPGRSEPVPASMWTGRST